MDGIVRHLGQAAASRELLIEYLHIATPGDNLDARSMARSLPTEPDIDYVASQQHHLLGITPLAIPIRGIQPNLPGGSELAGDSAQEKN